jgi:hypothetical protein
MKTLPYVWSESLRHKPETGMGYQVASVMLRDGRTVEDVAIIECRMITEVRGHADIPFDPDDIVGIELTHNHWKFRNRRP